MAERPGGLILEIVPATRTPSSPVTVRSLILAEKTVSVIGSVGATSVDCRTSASTLTRTLAGQRRRIARRGLRSIEPRDGDRRAGGRRHRDDDVLLCERGTAGEQQRQRTGQQSDCCGGPAPQSPDGRRRTLMVPSERARTAGAGLLRVLLS